MANRSSSPNPNLSRTPKSGVKTTPKKLPRANPHPPDLRSVEHNENEADPRMNRARSPAPKNFMSPTISAASKRKVLSEMNRSLTSFDSSDSMDSEVLNPFCHRWESPKVVSDPGEERENSPPAASAEEDEEEVVERESESALPPYDPKVNYLSPRPRFLRYRPKPRLEVFVNGEGDLKPEEESVASPKSEEREEENEELESSTEVEEEEEEAEELPVPRSSSKIKSVGMMAFALVSILGLAGFLWNPSWMDSSSEDLVDLQKLPGKMKNWSLDLAVSLREEDFRFFYSLDQESAIIAAEEVAEEEEEDYLVEDEEIEENQGSEEEGLEGTHQSSLMKEVDERETENAETEQGSEEAAIVAGEVEEREVDERETESAVTDQGSEEECEGGLTKEEIAVPSEEDNRVHMSLPSPQTLLGLFSALLALAAIAIALRVKQKHEKSSSNREELQGNYSPEMSSSGRRERVREGKLPEEGMTKGLRRDSITSFSPSYGSFTTYEKLSGKKDGATMTPVRRSSRIRHKVSSPS